MSPSDKPLVWLHGEIKTPPFSPPARVEADWRIVCRVDSDAIVILEVFSKKTQGTPRSVIETCIRRLREYDGA